MKKRLNISFAALLVFSLFNAAFVILHNDSVVLATGDTTQAGGKQGRGRWVKATESASGAEGQQFITDENTPADGKSQSEQFDKKITRFEVSENATRFIFDETPLFDDGAPAYGNEFVTEGYIYPAGTLNGVNGVNADGSPEFPDKVIGRWTCRGWHVGEGAKTVTGPWVVTHQLYDFGDRPGQISFASDGAELVDLNVPITRAVIGGTGPFEQARGEVVQTMVGFNQLNGVVLRFELKITKR
jgi:hypothetical protein